jgi:BirA family transcriptional regulator, biotin operon repressor / biotin---[acetyl-CoA-carboxylase] ligase
MPEPERLPSGWWLERHATLPSTNDRAGAWARAGRSLPAVIVAGTQTAGRGQRGRRWSSPPGAGLYASFVCRPEVTPAQSPMLTLLAGLALLDAIGPPVTDRLALKWPNDVWVAGGSRAQAKVAGILVEGAISETRLEHVVIGIGLNLRPAEREGDTISLFELGAVEDRSLEGWCDALAVGLDRRCRDFARSGPRPSEAEWTARAYGVGRAIRWGDGRREVQGRLLGIKEGGLLVRTESGPDEVFHHGRIEAFL